jgi:hypothetical protein
MQKFSVLALFCLLAFAVYKEAPIALEAPWGGGSLKIGKP